MSRINRIGGADSLAGQAVDDFAPRMGGKCPWYVVHKCPLYIAAHEPHGDGCVDDMARACVVQRGERSFHEMLRAVIRRGMELPEHVLADLEHEGVA